MKNRKNNDLSGVIVIYAAKKKKIHKALSGFIITSIILASLGAAGFAAARTAASPTLPSAASNSPLTGALLPSTDQLAQITPEQELQRFGLISPSEGWILFGSRLYWTSTTGDNWTDITPPLPASAIIHDVTFMDAGTGYILWSIVDPSGNLIIQASRTSTTGAAWTDILIQTVLPEDPDIAFETLTLGWLDSQTGWVSLKRQTGSNFSFGTLFRTDDAGLTWQRHALPIGGPVSFVDARQGWMAGGPARDQLFRTLDGGSTWEDQPVPLPSDEGQVSNIYPPVFDLAGNGLLAFVSQQGEAFQFNLYFTSSGGADWIFLASFPLGSEVSQPPVSILDARNLLATVPASNQVLRLVNGQVETLINEDGLSASIVDLDMLTLDIGWAKWIESDCQSELTPDAGGTTNITCTTVTKLIRTDNGGVTWQPIYFPRTPTDSIRRIEADSIDPPLQVTSINAGLTRLLVGQGFDACNIPTLAQLQAWWNGSPYKAVNVYIGGSARGCYNLALSASYIEQISRQG